MTHYIAWLDLETDGADKAKDGSILEVGVLITDKKFVPQDEFSEVIFAPPSTLKKMKPVVQSMHRETGLWGEVLDSDMDIWTADHKLSQLLSTYDTKLALGGSGVGHYDKPWVQHHMPETFKYLTHWVYDVGVVRRYLRDFCDLKPVGKEATNTGTQHRALDDAKAACEESRQYVKLLEKLKDA